MSAISLPPILTSPTKEDIQQQQKPKWKFLSDWDSFHHEKDAEQQQLRTMNSKTLTSPSKNNVNNQNALVLVQSPDKQLVSKSNNANVTAASTSENGYLIIRPSAPHKNSNNTALPGPTKHSPTSSSSLVSAEQRGILSTSGALITMDQQQQQQQHDRDSNNNQTYHSNYQLIAKSPRAQRNPVCYNNTHGNTATMLAGAASLFHHNPPLTSGPLRSIAYDYSRDEEEREKERTKMRQCLEVAKQQQRKLRQQINASKNDDSPSPMMFQATSSSSNTFDGNNCAPASATQLYLSTLSDAQKRAIEEGMQMTKMIPRSAFPFLVATTNGDDEFFKKKNNTKGARHVVSKNHNHGISSTSAISRELLNIAVERPWETTAQQRILDSCMETANSISVRKYIYHVPPQQQQQQQQQQLQLHDTRSTTESSSSSPTNDEEKNNNLAASSRLGPIITSNNNSSNNKPPQSQSYEIVQDPPPIEIAQPLEDMVRLRQLYPTLHPPAEQIKLASAEEGTPAEVRNVLTRVRVFAGNNNNNNNFSSSPIQTNNDDDSYGVLKNKTKRNNGNSATGSTNFACVMVVPVETSESINNYSHHAEHMRMNAKTGTLSLTSSSGNHGGNNQNTFDSGATTSPKQQHDQTHSPTRHSTNTHSGRTTGSYQMSLQQQQQQLMSLDDIVAPVLFTQGPLSPINNASTSSSLQQHPYGKVISPYFNTAVTNNNNSMSDSMINGSSAGETKKHGSGDDLREKQAEGERIEQLKFLRQKQREAEIRFGFAAHPHQHQFQQVGYGN